MTALAGDWPLVGRIALPRTARWVALAGSWPLVDCIALRRVAQ